MAEPKVEGEPKGHFYPAEYILDTFLLLARNMTILASITGTLSDGCLE